MKTLEELKEAVAYVGMSKREVEIIKELTRQENRSKSNMIRTLLLEALHARALAARPPA